MFPPIFRSKRLRLAAPQEADREIFAQWSGDDDYLRMLDDDPIRPLPPANYENFGSSIGENDYYFHLRTLEGDQLLGFVVLFNLKWRNRSAEMAIGIGDKADRGQGYGQEALWLILNYAFRELGLQRVGLTVMDYNQAAIKAYERAGFVHEGTLRRAVWRDGQHYDLLQYGVLREEWLAGQSS